MECVKCGEMIDATCQAFCHCCGLDAEITKTVSALKIQLSNQTQYAEIFKRTAFDKARLAALTAENFNLQTSIDKHRERENRIVEQLRETAKASLCGMTERITDHINSMASDIDDLMRQIDMNVSDELSEIDDIIDSIEIDTDF